MNIITNNPYRILGVFANSRRQEIIANKSKASAFSGTDQYAAGRGSDRAWQCEDQSEAFRSPVHGDGAVQL